MLKDEAIERMKEAESTCAQVEAMHHRTNRYMFGDHLTYCAACDMPWPCATRKIVDTWRAKNTTRNV